MHAPSVAIIMLNWNGWKDTCECLASLLESSYQDFQLILIDNGSTDGSIDQIKLWAKGELPVSVGLFGIKSKAYVTPLTEYSLEDIEKRDAMPDPSTHNKMILVTCPENLGFARGCNVGIRYAIKSGFQYVFLINNDTIVERFCLNQLVDYMNDQTDIAVSTPLIMYYDKPETIWAYGGKLTFFNRRDMYHMNKNEKKVQLGTYKEISFISGCAIFARTEVFKKFGLLTENFFFGEEDYELSLRMKKNHIKMAALSSAKVYHKVGASNTKIYNDDRLPYAFIGYLNRFIDKKNHCSGNASWKFWRAICLIYILPKLIVMHHYPTNRIYRFAVLLIQTSNRYDRVDREMFFKAKELLR